MPASARRISFLTTFTSVAFLGLFSITVHAECPFDVDRSGVTSLQTDGILLLRAARNITGLALIVGAGTSASESTIAGNITTDRAALDIDLDGKSESGQNRVSSSTEGGQGNEGGQGSVTP